MIIRLHPSVPVVWRTHDDLQIGVDPVIAVLTAPSLPIVRAVMALVRGSTRNLVNEIVGDANAVDSLLATLAPAFTAPPAPPSLRIVIDGGLICAPATATILRHAGHHVSVLDSPDDDFIGRPDVALIGSAFTVSPLSYQRWLANDVPHIPVIVGDTTLTIGPRTVPGRSACIACIERHRTDDDPAWPAIAMQLWGRPSRLDSPRSAPHIAGAVLHLLGEDPGTALRIDMATQRRDTLRWEHHPLCECGELEATATRKTDSVSGVDH